MWRTPTAEELERCDAFDDARRRVARTAPHPDTSTACFYATLERGRPRDALARVGVASGRAHAATRATRCASARHSGVESALTNGGVKSLFRRVRPRSTSSTTIRSPTGCGGRSRRRSRRATPRPRSCARRARRSGHARRSRWFALAALVAGSRVYVRMHHASDVAGRRRARARARPGARRRLRRRERRIGDRPNGGSVGTSTAGRHP